MHNYPQKRIKFFSIHQRFSKVIHYTKSHSNNQKFKCPVTFLNHQLFSVFFLFPCFTRHLARIREAKTETSMLCNINTEVNRVALIMGCLRIEVTEKRPLFIFDFCVYFFCFVKISIESRMFVSNQLLANECWWQLGRGSLPPHAFPHMWNL